MGTDTLHNHIWCQLLFEVTQCYIFLLLMFFNQVNLLMSFNVQPNSLTFLGKIRYMQ